MSGLHHLPHRTFTKALQRGPDDRPSMSAGWLAIPAVRFSQLVTVDVSVDVVS